MNEGHNIHIWPITCALYYALNTYLEIDYWMVSNGLTFNMRSGKSHLNATASALARYNLNVRVVSLKLPAKRTSMSTQSMA
jgi:hypothetical protein